MAIWLLGGRLLLAGVAFLWYAYMVGYVFVLLCADRQPGGFFCRWGPGSPRYWVWWRMVLWGGAVPVCATMWLAGERYMAVFFLLVALAYLALSLGGVGRPPAPLDSPPVATAD